MEETFYNLFLNACEAMPEGGTITCGRRIQASAGKSYAVSVTDTGKGIPENRIPQIFTPFYTTKKEGVNYGLVCLSAGAFYRHITENNCEKHAVFRNYFHTVVPSQPYP